MKIHLALRSLLLPLCLVGFSFISLHAQNERRDHFRSQLRIGVNLLLGYNGLPAFTCSVGGDVGYHDSDFHWINPSVGLTVHVYKGIVGTSSHPDEANDLIVDLIGSLFVTGGKYRGDKYNFQRIDNFQPYATSSIHNRYDSFSGTIGTSFILNSKKRNQQIGHIGFSIWDISLMYYNDGGAPISNLSLGDKYDRWWTGGLHLSVHPQKWDYRASATYHVFTGYSKNAYKLSTLLNLNAVIYGTSNEYFLNNGLFTFEVQHKSGYGIGLDISNEKLMFLQNFIHTRTGTAQHPSIIRDWIPKLRLFYEPSFYLNSRP